MIREIQGQMKQYAKSRLVKSLIIFHAKNNVRIPNLMSNSKHIDSINHKRSLKVDKEYQNHDWHHDKAYQYYMKYSLQDIQHGRVTNYNDYMLLHSKL